MRLAFGCIAISMAIYVCACSGPKASDDDDGGSSGESTSSSGKGGSVSNTGGTGNVGKGGGSLGGTGGTSNVGKGGGSVGGSGGGTAGPSGVPSDAYLDELTADQLHALCVWGVPLQGGPGQKQCDSTTTVTTETVEECSVDMVTIHCTVAMLETCELSLNGDPCAILTSTACLAYIDCAAGN
jgi:hypothetical protein